MRLHTNTLAHHHLYAAALSLPGVNVTFSEHGSRSHARAFDVSLTGTSNHRPNSGTRGAEWNGDYAATWDEWGMFLGYLFDVDSEMVAGTVKRPTYNGSSDFHYLTDWRFETLTPETQHRNHRWQFAGVPREQACTCGAVRRWAA
jgi:hypothetical protein